LLHRVWGAVPQELTRSASLTHKRRQDRGREVDWLHRLDAEPVGGDSTYQITQRQQGEYARPAGLSLI